MFGHVVGIALDDTGWLPAKEMALGIRAESINAIQIGSPLRARLHLFLGDSGQRDTNSGIPDVVLFINSPLPLPPGIPCSGVVVVLSIQVDGQVNPIPSGGYLELAIHSDVGPIVAEEKLHNIAVPEL